MALSSLSTVSLSRVDDLRAGLGFSVSAIHRRGQDEITERCEDGYRHMVVAIR